MSIFYQGLLSPLGMGAESEERPQPMVCYRASDETGGGGGFYLEELRET